ncbi:MAG: hypothetical protein WBO45_12630, partial [Planctomycetota bacterium]
MAEPAGRAPFEALLALRGAGPVALLHSGGAGPDWLCTDPVDALTLPAGAWRGGFAALADFLARHRQRRTVGWLG